MAPRVPSGDASVKSVVAAVDNDKNSLGAMCWAVDNLINHHSVLTLVHVRLNNNENQGDTDHIFLPCRGYCARKGIQVKEVVVDDSEVARALLEYVNHNLINTIVLGGTAKKAFSTSHKVKIYDWLLKSAPEFCSVYVISKGKVLNVKTALPPASKPGSLNDKEFSRLKSGPKNNRRKSLSLDSNDTQTKEEKSWNLDSLSVDPESSDSRGSTEEPSRSISDVEAEMNRLRLQLNKTMEMYNTACKEALVAKKTVKELNELMKEEVNKYEEARVAEEAALAMVEVEKAKCKAAMEVAEKAQRMAEIEALKRKQAETKAKKEAEDKDRALTALAHTDLNRYRKYTIEEIEEATQELSESNKIGEGGYGPVYRGTLDHTPVAIKVLGPNVAQGQRQFQQEVEVLCTIRHPNMVLLLGACPEYGCLVYEYMNYGSLEDRLCRKGNTPPISWRNRFKIAAEIATALLFLHQAKPDPLVHRDLKPANILLDKNFVSKISDVGLARLVPPSIADNVTQYRMTSAAGTFCYIDPEYQQSGKLTTKSDIYSLGIMLLQIITAKSPMGLAHQVLRALKNGTLSTVLDPGVPDWPIEEATVFAKLALKCAELSKKDRPDLSTVIVPTLNRLKRHGKRSGHDRTTHTRTNSASSTSPLNSVASISPSNSVSSSASQG